MIPKPWSFREERVSGAFRVQSHSNRALGTIPYCNWQQLAFSREHTPEKVQLAALLHLLAADVTTWWRVRVGNSQKRYLRVPSGWWPESSPRPVAAEWPIDAAFIGAACGGTVLRPPANQRFSKYIYAANRPVRWILRRSAPRTRLF